MTTKPTLIKSITKEQFKDFYWLKSELIDFCSHHNLPTNGSKEELSERISTFLKTGQIIKAKANKLSGRRDSKQIISCETPVIYYKNDAKTKEFFVRQIGSHFHFNRYLRQFTNSDNITSNLTYGDLVSGWIAEETKKKEASHKTSIGKQFEYNRFIRDFFAHETGKALADAIKAWKLVSSMEGPNTYSFFLMLK